jgi:hypothetical protein
MNGEVSMEQWPHLSNSTMPLVRAVECPRELAAIYGWRAQGKKYCQRTAKKFWRSGGSRKKIKDSGHITDSTGPEREVKIESK